MYFLHLSIGLAHNSYILYTWDYFIIADVICIYLCVEVSHFHYLNVTQRCKFDNFFAYLFYIRSDKIEMRLVYERCKIFIYMLWVKFSVGDSRYVLA